MRHSRIWLLAALLAALLSSIAAMAHGWLVFRAPPQSRDNPHATVPLSSRPADFWRTAGEAVAIADRQPAVRSLRARYPAMPFTVFPGIDGQRMLGVWEVTYFPPTGHHATLFGQSGHVVLIADRSGIVLETSSQAWPIPWETGVQNPTWRVRDELVSALLGAVLLVLMWDTRRFFTVRNIDLLAVLSLGISMAFYDRGLVLVSVPLQYPPLLYLAVRLAWVGARRVQAGLVSREPAAWANMRTLWVALAALLVARALYNLLLGDTSDVAFASVLGANGIHHGWPLYWPGNAHLDTYGPAMYLSYLPFEVLFPDPNWLWNWLPAAHVAAITFDALTVGGLILLGRRLKPGESGTRLGLVLALGWTANPWTLQPLAASTNDGLIALLLVAVLLAASSPIIRGTVLGWAVAAKFAPLALAGLFCFSTDGVRRPRSAILFGAALSATAGIIIWAFLPPQGFSLFWAHTIGFQLGRHSFMGIWDQLPQLEPLRMVLEAGVVGLAAALLVWPRRRELYQVSALAGLIVIGLELTMRSWSYLYVDWYMPAALVAILGAPALVPVSSPVHVHGAEPLAATAGAG
ncbi:MAG TPA: hypothetical protein VME22_06750 [Solirubrobacteraceae bacterium]|nr:hypothetical protein [Solirubrobacteraceae bacterium]